MIGITTGRVCLFAMCSRVLGKVIAKSLAWWAEHLELLDESKAGFRKEVHRRLSANDCG